MGFWLQCQLVAQAWCAAQLKNFAPDFEALLKQHSFLVRLQISLCFADTLLFHHATRLLAASLVANLYDAISDGCRGVSTSILGGISCGTKEKYNFEMASRHKSVLDYRKWLVWSVLLPCSTIKMTKTSLLIFFSPLISTDSDIWAFDLWGNPRSFWVALQHRKHWDWGVEVNNLPKWLIGASAADGVGATGSEGEGCIHLPLFVFIRIYFSSLAYLPGVHVRTMNK